MGSARAVYSLLEATVSSDPDMSTFETSTEAREASMELKTDALNAQDADASTPCPRGDVDAAGARSSSSEKDG